LVAEHTGLNAIIDNLLILARLERGQMPGTEPVSLARSASACVMEAQRLSPECRLRIDNTGDAIVLGEPVLIRQVVMNLLSNAMKYGSVSAPIEVHVLRSGRDGQLSVLDRGPQFDDAEMQAWFEPFYRSAETGSRSTGTGIGLSVCKRVIEAQGGQVWARPRAGRGADMGFLLPCAEE
jgi:signal transduction histidine kinase